MQNNIVSIQRNTKRNDIIKEHALTDVELLLLERIAEKERTCQELYNELLYGRIEPVEKKPFVIVPRYKTPIIFSDGLDEKEYSCVNDAEAKTGIVSRLIYYSIANNVYIEFRGRYVKFKKKVSTI